MLTFEPPFLQLWLWLHGSHVQHNAIIIVIIIREWKSFHSLWRLLRLFITIIYFKVYFISYDYDHDNDSVVHTLCSLWLWLYNYDYDYDAVWTRPKAKAKAQGKRRTNVYHNSLAHNNFNCHFALKCTRACTFVCLFAAECIHLQ